ncbi:oxidoreductase [Embleya scabrispora]|uniref:Oxidoreductase n=1 Tax=Embleya scabrispora TaxID=159449 RepID=A0A1T3NSF9_9ACTN|nr:FAD-dependent oxidoreductase [Embleya scabrispora]OPC79685.1 oxidoreductase [Embleya scabrispora]
MNRTSRTSTKHRVVVLGAGYAGAITAGRLAKRVHGDDVEITLVNAEPDFVERIRLHQLAAGQDLPRRPLRDIYANTDVRVRIARVASVDADRKTVELIDENGTESLGYDTLVYALGSTAAASEVPGVAEYAHSVSGRQGALRLRARLAEAAPDTTVLIVGGGLTGIEAAAEIAEAYPTLRVALATRAGLGDWLGEKARHHLRGAFARFGITVHEDTDVTAVEEDHVLTRSGERIPARITVWANGFAVHPIAAAGTLDVTDTGRIVVDATLRSVSHPDVYAVGDAAYAIGAGGKPLRMSCAAANPMAWLAADGLAARLTGRKAPQTEIGYRFQCISLGRHDAIVQHVTPDDRPKPKAMTGRNAARFKEMICSATTWSLGHPTNLMPSRRHRVTTPTTTHPEPATA